MTNQLSKDSASLVAAVNKLNKYVCAYPTRGVNISNALKDAGCKKMNAMFDLADKATNEKDVAKLKASAKSLIAYIERYSSRQLSVYDALKITGTMLLTNIEVLADKDL